MQFCAMAENFYSVKTALHVGIVQILGGLISIGIGAFNTRKEDHQAFFKFKPEGLPVWSGILFVVTGGIGCLSYKHPKKITIHAFLVFCIFTIIASILMFWIILPVLVSGEKDVSWNLFFGSFLGVVAITFVVSMKGAFIAFKSSFFQYNCCNKPPHLQLRKSQEKAAEIKNTARTSEPVELSSSACMITSTSVASENTLEEIREQRRISRSQSQPSSTPRNHSHHSHRHHRPRGHSSRRGAEREARTARHDERPPPPPYQTIKLPYLPAYQEVEVALPPPPYTEKKEDT